MIATVSHMTKTCALRLTPQKLYFIMNDSAAQGGVTIWCEVDQVRCAPSISTLLGPTLLGRFVHSEIKFMKLDQQLISLVPEFNF